MLSRSFALALLVCGCSTRGAVVVSSGAGEIAVDDPYRYEESVYDEDAGGYASVDASPVRRSVGLTAREDPTRENDEARRERDAEDVQRRHEAGDARRKQEEEAPRKREAEEARRKR
jgi:hypothetical protein